MSAHSTNTAESRGPKALITGGGGAIARAVALRLDQMGYQLILSDINEERARETAAMLSVPAEVIRCDQTDPDDCRRLIRYVQDRHPDLEVLVNNAGYIKPGDYLDLPEDELEKHIAINLTSPMRLTRGIAPLMQSGGRGAIVSIVSMGGIVALRGSALYSAAKFGLRGFLSSLYAELKPHGVRVSGVYPVAVDTPMLEHEASNGGSPLNFVNKVRTTEEVADAVIKGIQTGRLEIYVPYGDGLTGRLGVLFPWLLHRLEPLLFQMGKRGQQNYLKRKGLEAKSPVPTS